MKILQTFGIAATPTQTTATWLQPAQRVTILERTNRNFPRTIILTNDGIRVAKGTTTCGITIADLILAMVTLEPTLTYVPIIGTQPSAASCVHSSTAATFTVVATSETGITQTYQWQYNAKAVGTLTNDGSQPTDGSTVVIGSKTYTFQSSLTNTDGHVKIGGSNTASMTNLFHAINGTGGVSGTDYAASTVANTQVVATNPTGTTVVITAITAGSDGNSIATTQAGTSHCTWGTSTMASGGWASASGTVNGCVYTNGTTATLTCTPTTTGQTGFSHRVQVTNTAGTTTSSTVALTIT